MLNEEQIKKLIDIASKKMASEQEEFDAMDYSGGNFDDAYYMGTEDGEISMAREVLDMIGVEYEIEE
jgi:hypothetical protein